MFNDVDLIFGIDLVLVLLSYQKPTNTNKIKAFGIVFQCNTIFIARIVSLIYIMICQVNKSQSMVDMTHIKAVILHNYTLSKIFYSVRK